MVLRVFEIFTSIMGERGDGRIQQGDWTAFLRLAGCNLRCKWCDTKQAQSPEAGTAATVDDVQVALLRQLVDFSPRKKNVLVTGGEPLLQKEALKELFDKMLDCRFVIETNGSIPIDDLIPKSNVSLVVDHKGPSSGMLDKMVVRAERLRQRDTMKFVIATEEDYLEARDFIRNIEFPPLAFLVMSPAMDRKVEDSYIKYQLPEWIKRDKLFNVGISVQIHKLLSVE